MLPALFEYAPVDVALQGLLAAVPRIRRGLGEAGRGRHHEEEDQRKTHRRR